jgi:outer membrane protein assembly factor BamB
VPAFSGTALYVNTGLSVRRYEATHGSNAWTTLSQPHVVDEADLRGDQFSPKMPMPSFGALVTDGLVICRRATSVTTAGRLRCSALAALDASTGAVRWETRDNPELTQLHLASEPGQAEGLLYVLTRNRDAGSDAIVRATALEARSGRILWHRALTMGPDKLGHSYGHAQAFAFELPRPLVTPRGIFFSTHMGRFFLLDALTGAVVWMRDYPRAPNDETTAERMVNPSLYRDGRIVAAPLDSWCVYALEAASGRLVWSQAGSRAPVLCGLWQDKVVSFGRQLRLRDLATGASAGYASVTNPPARPVGYVNQDRLWVSGTNGASLFDLRALKPLATVPGPNHLLPAGPFAVRCTVDAVAVFPCAPAPAPGH